MKIKDVTIKYNISKYTLHYYEKEGLLQPERLENHNRNYQEDDLKILEFIIMMRTINTPIKLIKEYIILLKQGPSTINKRHRLIEKQLINVKKEIQELKIVQNKLENKLKYYSDLL